VQKATVYSAQRQLNLQREARADPQVCMFEDFVPNTGENSVYLVPTFSDTRCAHNHFWHLVYRELLRELGYHGVILIPQNRCSHGGSKQNQHLHWCEVAQAYASHVVFAIENNQTEQEVRQITHQIGISLGRRALGSSQVILVVAPKKRILCPLTRYHLAVEGIPIFSNPRGLLRHLVRNL